MDSLFRALDTAQGEEVKALVGSLHFLPITVCACIAVVHLYFHNFFLAPLALVIGVAITAVISHLEPVVTLIPMQGKYRAGMAEFAHTKEVDGNGCPPLTVFYPTLEEKPERRTVPWVPFMDSAYLRAMASYVGIPSFALKDLQLNRLAVSADAPPISLYRKDGSQRPIFLYSHGLLAYARQYSLFLSSLATQGAFVIALNHTDGSAAHCRDPDGTFSVPFRADLEWVHYDREPQLRHRIDEVRATIAQVVNGTLLRKLGVCEADTDRYVSSNPQVVLMGHSFGGSTVLATAHEEEKKMRAGQRNLTSVIACVGVHDPWSIPLWGRFTAPEERENQTPGEDIRNFTEANATYSTPTLLHHSESWTLDEANWRFFTTLDSAMHAQTRKKGLLTAEQRVRIEDATERVRKAAQPVVAPADAEDWFAMRIAKGTSHLSVTDVPFISPVVLRERHQTAYPQDPLHRWVKEAMAFAEVHTEMCRRV